MSCELFCDSCKQFYRMYPIANALRSQFKNIGRTILYFKLFVS